MLKQPDLSTETIMTCLRGHFGLNIKRVTFLPIGNDINTAVYRVDGENGRTYLLKLRREAFEEVGVAVPYHLHSQGIEAVMAPVNSTTQQLWVSESGFIWILYPFLESHTAYESPLLNTQWVSLGQTLKAIHSTSIPKDLSQRLPREDFSAPWCDTVKKFDLQVETKVFHDPVATRLADFWLLKRSEIRSMVERTEQLGQKLQQQNSNFVLCHADMHPGNILLGVNQELAIVDWDSPILAPKERDLMFIGGGLGFIGEDPLHVELFYEGYGPTKIDPVILAYYRNERIVADIAAYALQIFGEMGSKEDREVGLHLLMRQFEPTREVNIAQQTYQNLL